MHIVPFLWLINFNFIYFYLIIVLSWKLNKNRCLITQLEYKIFGETFLGNGPKFNVPKKHRYILYYIIIFNLILNHFIQSNHN